MGVGASGTFVPRARGFLDEACHGGARRVCAFGRRRRGVPDEAVGARSGRRRRIEIWFSRADGEIYLTTAPARRDWYANIVAHPAFTIHLKHGLRADLDAVGTPVTDEPTRRRVLRSVIDDLNQPRNPAGLPQPVEPLEAWMAGSPLVHVTFPE